jgi:5-methylcytosine-specific restriction protein B
MTIVARRRSLMPSYLFGWNPMLWPWDSMNSDRTRIGIVDVVEEWACSNAGAQVGDLAYIVRYGAGVIPKGIIAKGVIVRSPHPAPHLDPARGMTPHVDIKFEEIRFTSPDDIVPLSALDQECPGQKWNPQNSGIVIKPHAAECLERLWLR